MRVFYSAALVAVVGAGAASAQTDQEGAPETVTISAATLRSLEQFTPTASRLGLSQREIPMTLDTIDADTIIGRGYATVEQAADSLPGVISGGSPGDLSSFAMRGFSDDQITILHNGLYLGPSDMVNRPANTFNLQSVEVLKGPASVLYGQGAIGGAVNMVNKGASFSMPSFEALASYGSFGTTILGIGGTTHIGDKVAFRGDISRTGTDGYVHHTPSDSLNATASMLWHAAPNFDVQISLDYLNDHPSPYWGTPLVPASFAAQPVSGVIAGNSGMAIDERMRFVNYNVADYQIHSEQYWPQVLLKWQANPNLTFQNLTYYFHATRRWIDAETYAFNPVSNLVDRDRFFVFHDQSQWGDQGSMTYKSDLGGMMNSFVLGFDYSHLDFVRSRGFPDGDSVDPFDPSPGLFGPIVPLRSPTRWNDTAVFFEDALSITQQLKFITGGRYDSFDLVRENYDAAGNFLAASSFTRTFNPFAWRFGLVYDVTPDISPYVSYATGQDPPGSNIMLVNSGENFSLSHSHQVEGGIKATLLDGRATTTLAVYNIERKNFLSLVAVDTVSNVGSQELTGFEFSGDVKLFGNWSVSANLAYTDSHYGSFVDPNFGVNATGNEPANIPKWTANLWTSVSNVFDTPLELGGGVRFVGDRFGNTANSYKLASYALVNLYASYRLNQNVLLAVRANNLFDQAYAQWADVFYPSEIILGAPRSVEVSMVTRF